MSNMFSGSVAANNRCTCSLSCAQGAMGDRTNKNDGAATQRALRKCCVCEAPAGGTERKAGICTTSLQDLNRVCVRFICIDCTCIEPMSTF